MSTLRFSALSLDDKQRLEALVLKECAEAHDEALRKQQREAKYFPYRHPIKWFRIRRMVRSWR